MIGIDNTIDGVPVLITVDDNAEILVIEIQLKSMKLRVATGYGPQEEAPADQINEFYRQLEEIIIQSEDDQCGLIIEMDANAKLGREILSGDPHEMSDNGKLLWDICSRRGCFIVNTSSKCSGSITRHRIKKDKIEKSILDFVIVNSKVEPYIQEMIIDESKSTALSHHGKKGTVVSDHNVITCTFNVPIERKMKVRREIFALRDEDSLRKFKDVTTNTEKFTQCFKNGDNIRKQGKKWMKTLINTIHQIFQKVRLRSKPPKKKQIHIKLDVVRRTIDYVRLCPSRYPDTVPPVSLEYQFPGT